MSDPTPLANDERPSNASDLHLLFRIHQMSAAVPARCVREILRLPRVTRLPSASDHVLGVVDLRGDVMPLVDLRRRLGRPSNQEEKQQLAELLRTREADHHRWLDELQSCVRDGREFKLARDPHQCAFGRWYDTYKPDNRALEFIWDQFARPHREIHALAEEALGYLGRGERDRALALIEHARGTTLASLVELFGAAVHAVESSSRDLAVVLESGGESVAVSIDAAEAVEVLESAGTEELPELVGASAREMVAGIARRTTDGSLVLLLDQARLFPSAWPGYGASSRVA